MRIAAMLLSSDTKQAIIKDCLLSFISKVDVLIYGHIPLLPDQVEDDTSAIIHSFARKFKIPLFQIELESATDPISDWRNKLLDFARLLKVDWAMQIDTDERMVWNGLNIRATLEMQDPNIECLVVPAYMDSYEKPRFFRCAWKKGSDRFCENESDRICQKESDRNSGKKSQTDFGRYIPHVRTHEDYAPVGTKARLPRVKFDELTKDPAYLLKRSENDVIHLKNQHLADINNPRWPQLIGDTCLFLERINEALLWYDQTILIARLAQNRTAENWARICSAKILFQLGMFDATRAVLIDCDPWSEALCTLARVALVQDAPRYALGLAQDAIRAAQVCQPWPGRPHDPDAIWADPWLIAENACVRLGMHTHADKYHQEGITMRARFLIYQKTGM